MTKPGPSVTSGADTQPGSDSLFPSGFGGGAAIRAGGVGTSEIADSSVAAADLNLPSVASALAARSEFTGAYARAFPVAAPTGVAATDTANITAKAQAASAAGGGVVILQGGQYELNASLPVLPGVGYQGVRAQLTQVTRSTGAWLADGVWSAASGTILHGDGTFECFSANTTPAATVPANIGTTEIPGVHIYGLVLSNFTSGIHVGSANQIGLTWGSIDEVYITGCSSWGINLVNFAHMTIGKVAVQQSQHGQRYASELAIGTFQPANSTFRDLYVLTPNDGRDRRTCRAILFESLPPPDGADASLGQLEAMRVQANRYNVTRLSETATFTSGSASVAIADGTKYQPGYIVRFTTTAAGFTANQMYVVLTVAGNTITLANSKKSAAISANASTTATIETYGYPAVDISGGGTGAVIGGVNFRAIDSEGSSTVGVYLEAVRQGTFQLVALPQSANSMMGICARDVQLSEIHNPITADTDFDANSSNSFYYGGRGTAYQRPLRGAGFDSTASSGTLNIGGGQSGQQGGDLHVRSGGFIYPTNGMGSRIFPRDSAITLGGINCGICVCIGTSPVTWTLPAITTDATTYSGALVGVWYEIWNVGTSTMTINTSSSQLLNKVAAKTSTTIAASSAVRFTAARDSGGTLFWLAAAVSLIP